MKTLEGFKNIKEIHQSKKTILYSAERVVSKRKCIIKIIKEELPSFETISRIKNEFDIARNLPPGITVKYFAFDMYQERPYIVMEYAQAITLKKYIKENKVDLKSFFKIAIKIATAIGKIHEQNIIHKDINSNNILINTTTDEIFIVDFNIATRVNSEKIQINNFEKLEGTLEYISPEQTGRMNRSIDYRSDYFSLGITLYELLYNKLPFYSKEPLELIHSHIAKNAIFNKTDIKYYAINKVIEKLINKNAENRYQSIHGLLHDLKKISSPTYTNTTDFIAAEKDLSNKLQIPEKLYGRDNDISILLENIILGKNQLQLISGNSGIGKTVLINEIQKHLLTHKAYYVKGKCEKFAQNIPYRPLIKIFSELVKQILSEDSQSIQQKKQKLLKVLDGNGKILTDYIPELQYIIGIQKKIENLGAIEMQNISEHVIKEFIACIGQDSKPIIIFIDDLHWADLQTLNILEKIILDDDIKHIHIIGTFHDDKINNSVPLILTLKNIKETGKEIHNIKLQKLKHNEIEQLLKDTFPTKQNVEELANIIINKTSGNPFFVKEFIKEIYNKEYITFDFKKLWTWNNKEIKQIQVSDNVAEIMINKLLQLPKTTLSVLKNASLISVTFDLYTISAISNLNPKQTNKYLWDAINAGLIQPISNNFTISKDFPENETRKIKYKFQHNRVREASYELINENEKARKHLKIAQQLFKLFKKEQTEEYLFDLTNHYNKAEKVITDKTEIQTVCELNIKAAKKAKASTAYKISYEYLTIAKSLLPENHFKTNYELSYKLYKELGECEHLIGNDKKAIEILSETYNNAQNNIDKLQIAILQVGIFTQLAKFDDVNRIVIKSLKNVDIIIPENKIEIEDEKNKEMLFFQTFLKNNKLESLLNNISNDETELLTTNLLISALDASILFGNSDLGILATYKIINQSIKKGINKNSASGFAIAGMYANTFFNDFELAYKLGNFGYTLSNKLHNPATHHKILIFHGFMCAHFKEPFHKNIEMLQESYSYAKQNGDYAFATYAIIDIIILKYSTGENLFTTKEYLSSLRKFIYRTNINVSQHLFSFLNILVNTKLNHKITTKKALEITELNYNKTIDFCKPLNYFTGVGVVSIYFCEQLFIAKQYKESLQVIEKYPEMLAPVKGYVLGIQYYFYYSLSIYKNYNNFTPNEKKKYDKILKDNLIELKKYSSINPQNYLHYYAIVNAEQLSLEGKKWLATEEYERGILSAQKNKIQQIKAIGNELLADFYFSEKRNKIAFIYIRNAHFAYKTWGDNQKVKSLETQFPVLTLQLNNSTNETIISDDGVSSTTISSTSSSTIHSHKFDLSSAMKFAQNISEEVHIESLLKKMMSILIENAGADKGYFILNSDDNLFLVAEAKLSSSEINILQNIKLTSLENLEPEKQLLAINIVNYSYNSKETLVIDNALKDLRFANSSFIQKYKTKSVLCLPLIKQRKTIGLLYLENTLVTNAFTPARLLLLENLSSQIAISIENALLYKNLEQKVINRTAEINNQKEEILKQAQELIVVNKKLKELDKFKDIMAGMIVHDLKNPLNSIIGLAESDIVKQSGKQMLNMVMNILDVQKYENTNIQLHTSNNSIYEMSIKALQQVNLLYEQKNIKLINNIQDYWVISEAEIIERIFINILTNAIKYTPNNGTITLETNTIPSNLKVGEKPEFIHIKITDTGKGIPSDKLDTVFGKFEQIVAKDSGLARSTGLGLTFCKLFTEAHGGKIGVESHIDKGTSFWFTLKAGKQKNEMHKIKKEENEHPLMLTPIDLEILNPFLPELQKLEVYDYSKVKEILTKIDCNFTQNLKKWEEEMNKVLFATNEERYSKLINLK